MDSENVAPKKSTDAAHPTEVVLPNYLITHWLHELRLPDELLPADEKKKAKANLMSEIRREEMLPFYLRICDEFGWQIEEELVQKLQEANKAELLKLEEAITDAEKNYGDVEVKDAILAKANFICRIGDTVAKVEEAYMQAHKKTVGAGGRLDIHLTLVRYSLLCGGSIQKIKEHITTAKSECEKGGDWERKNKLRIYEGIYLAMCRRFEEAADLLLDSVAIFTATELMSFNSLICYAVVLGMVALDRPTLRTKVLNCPEVAAILAEDGALRRFFQSFYECDYRAFMEALVEMAPRIRSDFFIGDHYRYYIRNIRRRAYAQFLEPFKSVTIQSMADSFGVSVSFIESDVAAFIASGQLNCKINKVDGIVESSQPDKRNALYLQIIKQGDQLLNRIQKLSRVVDM